MDTMLENDKVTVSCPPQESKWPAVVVLAEKRKILIRYSYTGLSNADALATGWVVAFTLRKNGRWVRVGDLMRNGLYLILGHDPDCIVVTDMGVRG